MIVRRVAACAAAGLWMLAAAFSAGADDSENAGAIAARRVVSLDGRWQLTADGQTREVDVPGTFEGQVAVDFNGTATYARTLPEISCGPDERVLLEFNGVATRAEVRVGGASLGSHTGAWTPFRFEVTDYLRNGDAAPRLEVDVDEQVGHLTQGFLPIIAPHFGGIWQPVQLWVVPRVWIDDRRWSSSGDPFEQTVRLVVPVSGRNERESLELACEIRPRGAPAWQTLGVLQIASDGAVRVSSGTCVRSAFERETATVDWLFQPAEGIAAWSPDRPHLYEVRATLRTGDVADRVTRAMAFRRIETRGDTFLLNGHPLSIRGVLNWGYAPPSTAPSIDERWMAGEIQAAQSSGFNLMKFCLWVPPRRYLELCDELGLLAWIEYPTWHAPLTPEHLEELTREYTEFLAHDRGHPSVALRSLTCETGSGADLGVIRALYALCKDQAPGALVVDDSSWIEWNRVHDFYDDHPYGNNHTWPATLDRLNAYIAARAPMPLALGEAIAADTWVDPADFSNVAEDAFWRPRFLNDASRWLAALGLSDHRPLVDDSRAYAMLMRKYQIEAYRAQVPSGAYVVSVIRDFPLAAMGLLDYRGRPKWDRAAWSFHGPTMLLLRTLENRRSFTGGEWLTGDIQISHFGPENLRGHELRVTLEPGADAAPVALAQQTLGEVPSGRLSAGTSFSFQIPAVQRPTRWVVVAELAGESHGWSNRWPVWVFPADARDADRRIVRHASLADGDGEGWLGGIPEWSPELGDTERVVVARRWDRGLVEFAAQGGRVLMLPDGSPGSFEIQDHWFLRGAPVVLPPAKNGLLEGAASTEVRPDGASLEPSASSAVDPLAANFLVELQHFDLAGPVVPQIDSMLGAIRPWLVLWDTHDRVETATHGLVWEMGVGRGRVIVSALRHGGKTNSAGRWIAGRLVESLLAAGSEVDAAMADSNAERLRGELNRQSIELQSREWRFQPDAQERGQTEGWHAAEFDDRVWGTIRADGHWEGQGHASLDGWAWYRLSVDVPAEMRQADRLYLSFTGVDDYYRLYINGQLAGTGGDLESRRTAFDERASHDITSWIGDGGRIVIAVAVFDWQGAGGIFRPVLLGTTPLTSDRPWLK